MKKWLIYTEVVVWQSVPGTEVARERVDSYIADEWRVFATHAIVSESDIAVVYVLVKDMELEDDE